MAKQFLANQVVFRVFELNPPRFEVTVKGKIDGKGEEKRIEFTDEEGTAEDLLIVHHILGLLSASYGNAKARTTMGQKKFFTIALTVDDACTKILPPDVETSLAEGKGVETKVEVERTVTTKVTLSQDHGSKPSARGPHGP